MRFLAALRVVSVLALPGLLFNAAAGASFLEGKQLTDMLAAGGCYIVMRHPSSLSTPPKRGQAAPGNIGGEPQLDENGSNSARAMGDAFRILRIRVGKVMTSTAYRALQTAGLAGFPDAHAYDDLAEAGRTPERALSLRAQVAVPPDAGTNTVIITHSANITDAFAADAHDLAEGESLIYRPDGHGNFKFLARVKIEEWPRLATAH